MFTRTVQYQFAIPKELLKYRLVGNHMTIHKHEFEVQEDEQALTISPTVEENSKTILPITEVLLDGEGNRTKLVITSRMHSIEAGEQMLIMLFCVMFLVASLVMLYVSHDMLLTLGLCALSVVVFVLFLIKLQLGYFDYVRKLRSNIRNIGEEITADVRLQLFKHKMK